MAARASDKDRWNLLSPAASKSLAKEFDFGDAAKSGVVKGHDRWNVLRNNVQSISMQARGANAFASAGRACTSPSQRVQLFSSTLRRAARQDKKDEVLESPGAISVLTASEPAPEPDVAGDDDVGADADDDLKGKPGEENVGEDFSDWETESEVCKSEMETDTAAEGLREANVQLDKKVGNQHGLAIHIHGPSGRHSVLGTQPQQLGKPEESPIDDDEADPGHFIPANTCRLDTDVNETSVASSRGDGEEEVHNAWGGDDTDSKLEERATELEQARGIVVPSLQVPSTARDRLAKRRQRCQNNAETTSIASGASAADAPSESVMTRMMGGLPSWTMFSAANESEDEVHNAWGEQDTEEMLGQRALELQHARGIEIPGVPSESSAQARLAKRRHKAEAKRKAQLEVSGAGGGSHLFGNASSGMLSMLSSLTTVRAADAAQGDGEDEVHNAWGGDDTASKLEERATELEQARGIVVPSLQVPSTARDRLAKRRQRAQNDGHKCQEGADADAEEMTTSGRVKASFFAAAATSIMQFQSLFNLASDAEDEIDEVFCIWGDDDTPESYQDRVAAMEQARSEQSARLPHHRVIRQKRRGAANAEKKELNDPFLLELQEQIE